MRALGLVWLVASSAWAQVFPVETYATSAPDVMVRAALGDISTGSGGVKKSGDTMFGPLRLSASVTHALRIGPPGSTAQRGICFNPGVGDACTSSASITYNPAANYLQMNAPNWVGGGGSAMIWSGQIQNTTNSHPGFYQLGTAGLRIGGAVTGSLPAATAGSIHFDTTKAQIQVGQDGTNWESVATAFPWTALHMTGAAAAETTAFLGPLPASTAKGVTAVSCSWQTAGVGGATGVVVEVYDQTATASKCSCTLGACTTAANTPLSCACSSALTAANVHVIRLTAGTDCGTNPTNVVCTARLTP